MSNPYAVVRDFEQALADYTGAPHVVTVTSCTSAILLACAWHFKHTQPRRASGILLPDSLNKTVSLPCFTYVGVPMSIIHAGGRPTFRDEQWRGAYQLKPYPIWDCARWLYAEMYKGDTKIAHHDRDDPSAHYRITLPVDCTGNMLCLSFHHTKHLGISTHGGAILTDDAEAAAWLRRARFDGRTEGVAPKDDTFAHLGWHANMQPPTAAEGLMRLKLLPRETEPLPWGPETNSDYKDLSTLSIFK